MGKVRWGQPGCKVARTVECYVFSGGKRRAVRVTIYIDCIGLRLKGERIEFYLLPDSAYRETVFQTKRAEKKRRKEERKARNGR